MKRVHRRIFRASILTALVLVNIVVLFVLEPPDSDDTNDNSIMDWKEGAENNSEGPSETHEDVEGPDPGDQPPK